MNTHENRQQIFTARSVNGCRAGRLMTGMIVILAAVLIMPERLSAAAPSGSVFSPYQVILDREPFGRTPPPPPDPPPREPEPEPPPLPIRPEESFARVLRLTFIIRENSGMTRVGIVNERQKKNYTMEIGEIDDGIELVSVDYDQERVLLRHEEEEAWLSMRGDPLEAGRAGSMTPAAVPAQSQVSQPISRHRRRPPSTPPRPALTREEYEASRDERPPPRPPRAALAEIDAARILMPDIPEDATPDERRQLLREYNLELIRARGDQGPPLPIELTPEEDDQLVREGVLPPMD